MSASGNRINYNLRASKSVERRMILYALKELFKHDNFLNYRYIGFGSTYFTDFKLFHKELNIENMISFELEESLKDRVEFNRPFNCIKIQTGKSTDLLPYIWGTKTKDFIWMDYDGYLEYDFFNDLEIIIANANPGSVYLMSCNKQLKYKTIQEFEDVFEDLVPINITTNDFSGDKDFLTIRRMLMNKIQQVVELRNYALPEEEQIIFRPLFFFTYKDNAPMVSFGGIIDYAKSSFGLEKYNLNNFDFIKQGADRFTIDPPLLTHKEVYLLNSHLPNSHEDFVNVEEIKFIPETDRNKYRKLYKFLPNYMEVLS